MIKLETSMGDIVLELNDEKAPKSAANFVQYVEEGHYDGTIFHRVIPGFMIQGGGMTEDMTEKGTNDPVKNEANNKLKNDKYTVAMARTMDPHSATAQFFINVADNDFLNFRAPTAQGWGYAVFGKVVEGTEVVDKIAAVKTTTKGFYEDCPEEAVTIVKATVVK
ncbi:MAG: peptidyl-prolyl cis-trans isomerase [Desulfovibrionaceae bacterium]|nr:peptidyl-prolyl cis-trans isomerase [Desulfovibrionaceae bacterium]